MKLDIISDIHLTHHRDQGSSFVASWVPQGEILILAGDVGEFPWWRHHARNLITLCEKYRHTLFVAGNHDYYDASFSEADARFLELEEMLPNFHFLNRSVLNIDGVSFAGTSLWFRSTPENQYYSRYLSDFRLIKGFVPAVYQRNADDRNFLRAQKNVDVVITHHLPTYFSVHEKYANDPTNLFFLCEIDDIILDLQPKLFVHGHTHETFDYKLGGTRMICNPMGYVGEKTFGADGYQPITVELYAPVT